MTAPITVISSMATSAALRELMTFHEAQSEIDVALESCGGVDVKGRIRAGEQFDLVVLASGAIDDLIREHHLLAETKLDLLRSKVAVAVRAGSPRPDISSEEGLREAVLGARSIGYSTGPSGVSLARLFERWGLSSTLRARTLVSPPGTPVGALVASGQVELGFQQLAELMPLEGIEVLGLLPSSIEISTTFSAALSRSSSRLATARALSSFLASPAAAPVFRRLGFEPLAPSLRAAKLEAS